MSRPIVIVGAPSSIGIRPYDDGRLRRLDLAPAALRAQGIGSHLRATDSGDVVPPPYVDFVRPMNRPRNEEGVGKYSRDLANQVSMAAKDGAFVVVLGGDCSIVLGCLLAFRGDAPHLGLIYLDAHADFSTPHLSRTGSAASMCLALAVGRGETPLASLGGSAPLVSPTNVVLLGRRDQNEPWYGHDGLATSGILDLPDSEIRQHGIAEVAALAVSRVTADQAARFWIHVDADVIDPLEVPAVDSPEPRGLRIDEAVELLIPIAQHPRALGLELTIYDPQLDPDGSSAVRLANMLEGVLAS